MSKQSAFFAVIVVGVAAFFAGRMTVKPSDTAPPAGQAAGHGDAVVGAGAPANPAPAAGGAEAARAKPAASATPREEPASASGRPSKGSAEPLVRIFEVSDFQCPFCNRVTPTVKQIVETYPDVQIVWVSQPLPFHNQALPAARAALAAHRQGKFWQMHDKLFANQRNLNDANFEAWAKDIGLDVVRFKKDYADPAIEKAARHDQAIANAIGARGTPAFFINGKSLTGARPFDSFKTEIDAALKEARAELARGTPRARVADALTARNNGQVADYLIRGKEPPAQAAAPAKAKAAPPRRVDPTVYKVPVSDRDPALGSENALVTIVEFSDFQCPFCKRVVPTVKKIEESYGDRVRIIFKQQPLPFHNKARAASYAALAAHEQGKFWQMHDKLFENNTQLGRDNFLQWAGEIGLDVERFKKDFDDGAKKYDAWIAADQKVATDVNARGTPNFFVNGRKLTGAKPFEEFKTLIDEELAKAKRLVDRGVPPAKVYATTIARGKTFEPLEATVNTFDVSDHPTYGAKNGTLTLVEFSDFQCPFCSRIAPTLKQVVNLFPGQARLVYKNFPLSFHKHARPASRAALAARRQGKFWEMHDLIFDNFRNLSDDIYLKFAEQLGMDLEKFRKDMKDPAIDKKIDADQAEGTRAGVRGTPTFYINGRKYQAPDRSPDGIKRVIEQYVLKKKG